MQINHTQNHNKVTHTIHMFAGRTSSHTTQLCNNTHSKYQGKPEARKYCYTYSRW